MLNIVSGGNELGQWMTEHPIPRGVSFTGSIATGKKVNVAAAADLKRVLLELGGNDAAIVRLHRPADRLPDQVPGHQEGRERGPRSLVAVRLPAAT